MKFLFTVFPLGAQHKKALAEKSPISSLVGIRVRHLNRIPPPMCNRQIKQPNYYGGQIKLIKYMQSISKKGDQI